MNVRAGTYHWWLFCDAWYDLGIAMYWQVPMNQEAYEDFHYCWSMADDTFKFEGPIELPAKEVDRLVIAQKILGLVPIKDTLGNDVYRTPKWFLEVGFY